MMMQRRNPFNELRQMHDTMNRMWRRFDTVPGDDHNGIEAWAAPLDVVADGDDFVVSASLPGVAPDNI